MTKNKKKEITVFETFAGIGSQLEALKNIEKKLRFKTVSLGAVEWYIDAIINYQIFHKSDINIKEASSKSSEEMINILSKFVFSNDSKNPVSDNYFKRMNKFKLVQIFPYLESFIKDKKKSNSTNITELEKIPKNIDLFTYSFPCQDISQQGKQKGIKKGTRSGLLSEIERILKLNKNHLPKILVMENVKNLVHKKFLPQLNDWIKKLNSFGYHSEYKVLNAAHYGSAQNRERVFMVSVLNNKQKFEWPLPLKNNLIEGAGLQSIINWKDKSFEKFQHLKNYQISDFKESKFKITKAKIQNYTSFNSEAYIYLPKGIGPTLTASGANSRLKFYFAKNKIRSMNSCEAYQYMGFREKRYNQIVQTNLLTENKMIYLCGNSISIQVLEALFEAIIKQFLL